MKDNGSRSTGWIGRTLAIPALARTWIDAIPAREAWAQVRRLRLQPGPVTPQPHQPHRGRTVLIWVVVVIAAAVAFEVHTSIVQSRIMAALSHRVWYALQPGPSQQIVFPR